LYLCVVQTIGKMGFIKFLTTKTFFKHLGIAAAIVLIVMLVTFQWLKVYTRHGAYFFVPNIKGYNLAQVDRIVGEMHLRYEVIDSVYRADIPPLSVAEVYPAIGSKIKKERTLYIILNADSPEMVSVPDVTNTSVRQAIAVLQARGFVLGDTVLVPSEYKNLVLAQSYNGRSLSAGSKLPRGASVDLLVANGLSSTLTAVPELTGKTMTEARILLMQCGLNVGSVIRSEGCAVNPDSVVVFKQEPSAASPEVNVGRSVSLWLKNIELNSENNTENEFGF